MRPNVKWTAALTLACTAVLLISTYAVAAPRITVTPETVKFGEMDQGQTVEDTVTVRNEGDEDLVIARIKAPCACTGVMIDNKVIKPGETGALKVTFRSGTMKGDVTRTLSVHSNDPNEPEKVVQIKVKVNEAPAAVIQADPRMLDIGLVGGGEIRKHTIKIMNPGVKPLTIDKVTLSKTLTSNFEGELTIEPKGSADLEVTVTVPDRNGLFQEYVYITSNAAASPTTIVQVRGYVTQQAPARSLVISPVRITTVPGTDQQYYASFSLRNTLPVPVTLAAKASGRLLNVKLSTERIQPNETAYVTAIATRPPNKSDLAAAIRVTLELPVFLLEEAPPAEPAPGEDEEE